MKDPLFDQLKPIIDGFAMSLVEAVRESMREQRNQAVAAIVAAFGGDVPALPAPVKSPKPKAVKPREPKVAVAAVPAKSTVGCSKCGGAGHNARTCGREPKGWRHKQKTKAASSDDDSEPEPVDPRIEMIAAVARRREDIAAMTPIVEPRNVDPTDRREVCVVHGWVGRLAFQRDCHESCEPADEPMLVALVVVESVDEMHAEPSGRRQRIVRTEPRAKTIAVRRITQTMIAAGAAEVADVDMPERPRTRAECPTERPCPWAGCRHHLALDVDVETGSIKLNFPHLEIDEMAETCALDVADRGGAILDIVGQMLNLTRERVRQIERPALQQLRQSSAIGALGHVPDIGPDREWRDEDGRIVRKDAA